MSLLKGRFITVEGTEGVGKSTNMAFVKQWLEAKGHDVIHTREPGGTPFAEEIRELLLSKRDETVNGQTELLLMFAARCQHVYQKIQPALAQGTWVLCDRFTDASYAYQGAGRGLGYEKLRELEQWSLQGFKPDLTLMLDLPIEVGLERARKRGPADRFEEEKIEFFNKVRQGYLDIAESESERMKVINAEGSIEDVQKQIEHTLGVFYQQVVSA
ncbi:dTMP kinase [Kangiella geojedonensis]|uniref:Thymidylate kinase n=1 Tax=Kangiella geojedonensis TaxID=914150 RepID=A0A0F6TQI2_9GAMM|nr:dTMP kinase [Kangiella geojedonensis]AKE52015.1 thymidylate kinase [Kangiella geojedonensis]